MLSKFLLKWRYLIALLLFIIGVSFELHGSSIGNWNNFGVSEMVSGEKNVTFNDFSGSDSADWIEIAKNWVSIPPRTDGTVVGVPRMIRTDEWLVQTPYAISQVSTGNQFNNPTYGLSGMNMVLAYNSPVLDISVFGKPFNWGFLFLGASRGLSWYWCFKLLGMLLLSFEFAMILTKKNRFLSVIGSFWITFTPAIQWWFMQHLGDIVFFSLAIMVGTHHYFLTKSKLFKCLLAIGLSSSIIGFVLVIYPAFQVPFGYLIAIFFFIEFISALRNRRVLRSDLIIMSLTLLSAMSIVGWTLYRSLDALSATLNTVYPGGRVSLGGELEMSRFSDLLLNFILPFKIPTWTNQVEAASSVNLLPFIIPLLPFVLHKKVKREQVFGLFLTVYCLLLAAFAIVGIPELFAKVSLFSYVTGGRAWQAMSVMSVFASLWFIALVWGSYERRALKISSFIVTAVVAVLGFLFIKKADFIGFLGKNYLLLFLMLILFAVLAVLFKKKVIFGSIMAFLIALSGMTVNPVVKGLAVIEDKQLTRGIDSLVKENQEGIWLTENKAYNYPQMFGAKTINSVRFYPDLELMKILDPHGDFESEWNRYAHMNVSVSPDKTQISVGAAPDVLDIKLSLEDFERLGIDYVLTDRDLNALFGSSFKEIYQDSDSNKIYEWNR
ncbi:hypothetical protein HF992_00605 [Streptococcus ovuberis]|uniref:Uncharacterized protein n=2 Tax=Streptococcus ovuberis TaxID=1936207 RepID=A0A7X6S0P7_9STRE|nr:hypothetical protein [Streptococcus ovuberis]